MTVVRAALIALGVLGTLAGFWLLFTTVRPQSLVGLAVWLAGALVLHDGVLSGAAWFLNRLLKGAATRVPRGVTAVVQVGAITGFVISLLAAPLIIAKAKGPQVSTLPLDYGLNFGAVWLGIGAVTLAIVAFLTVRARSMAKPPPQVPPVIKTPTVAELAVAPAPTSTRRRLHFQKRSALAVGAGASLLALLITLALRATRRR